MKNKFIRILSPITMFVVFLLDLAAVGLAVFAVKKISEELTMYSICFAVIEAFAVIVAILVTKEVFKNGIIFYDDRFEFTGLDGKNIFSYSDIAALETYQDTKASLKKNFIDRHALIIITHNDDTVSTVDIGLTSKKTLAKIKNELAQHIGDDKIKNNGKG